MLIIPSIGIGKPSVIGMIARDMTIDLTGQDSRLFVT